MATFTQLPSKKWRVQVRKSGLYKAATFALKRDAQAWAAKIESQVEHMAAHGFQPVPEGYKLGDLLDAYIKEFDPHRHRLQMIKCLRRVLGNIPLRKLSAISMREFVESRIAEGVQGVTIAGDLSTLSTILKYARYGMRLDVRVEIAKEARADLSSRHVSSRSDEREREPTEAELKKLNTNWKANERLKLPMVDLVAFALATAMRQGEICRLQIEDVDRKEKSVLIRDRKDPRRKMGNHQRVPLLPDAWAIVERHIGKRTEGEIFNVDERSVSASFTRTCTKLKITDLRFHDLRHAAISRLFRAGLAIQEVALLSGHKNWKMLARYTHITPSDVLARFAQLQGGQA